MTEHTDRRDCMAREIAQAAADALGGAANPNYQIIRMRMAEPNFIEFDTKDGTTYTVRVCQKRTQPRR